MRLIISGVHKVPSAAATAFLGSLMKAGTVSAWLNIGIAGHGSADIGSAYLAHKILDASSGYAWYPQLFQNFSICSAALVTHDKVQKQGAPNLVDMEASGFYPTALRFSSAELVHVLKIVSDHADAAMSPCRPKQVQHYICQKLELIEHLCEGLRARLAPLAAERAAPRELQPILGLRHCTKSQELQLHDLLIQWEARYPERSALCLSKKSSSTKQLIQNLYTKLSHVD
jgi:hypothetical protein